MIIVFTGNGKGKTTAAIGQAIRALGQGKKVLLVHFIKSPEFKTGEEKVIKKLGPKIKLIKGGRGYVGILGDKLSLKAHKKAAQETLKQAEKAIISFNFDLVILDEINNAINLKLISKNKIFNIIKRVPKKTDLILTGRNAPEEFIKIAALVTDFKEIKHPFQKGQEAKRGIEY